MDNKTTLGIFGGAAWIAVGVALFCLWMMVWIRFFGTDIFVLATLIATIAVCLAFRKESHELEKASVGICVIFATATATWSPIIQIWLIFAILIILYIVITMFVLIKEGWSTITTSAKSIGPFVGLFLGLFALAATNLLAGITVFFITIGLLYLKATQKVYLTYQYDFGSTKFADEVEANLKKILAAKAEQQ